MRLIVVAMLIGCGSGTGANSPLLGDWWECVDPTCSAYDQDAARFNADDTWVSLRVLGQYTPPEAYCASTSDGDRGTYVFDNNHLDLIDRLGRPAGAGAALVFHDDMFDVHPDNGGGTWYRRIAVVMFTGDCNFSAAGASAAQAR